MSRYVSLKSVTKRGFHVSVNTSLNSYSLAWNIPNKTESGFGPVKGNKVNFASRQVIKAFPFRLATEKSYFW